MAIAPITPALWFDAEGGVTNTVVTEGSGKAGFVKIYGFDSDGGVPGLDLTNDAGDSDNAARIIKAILEHMYQYQEGITAADRPTTMVISRSSSSSGANLYTTYSLRFIVDAASAEVADE
jgi:hypothetical protein